MKFVQARNYTPGRIRPIRLVVWHDMEAPEARSTAENVAAWFAGSNAPQASAHLNGDPDSVVQSVAFGDTAWSAPGMNADGIHLEQAGYASQTRAQWLDADSRAIMANLAAAVAPAAVRLGIPPRFLSDADLRAGRAGMTAHVQGTRVYNGGQGHTDPGRNFPYDVAEDIARAAWAKAAGTVDLRPTGGKYLTEDGVLDRGTAKVVQAWVGATRDGSVGPETLGRLQRRVGRPQTGTWTQRDTDALARLVDASLVGHPWSYGWATKSDPLTLSLERYLNRGLRAGTFNPAS